MAEEVIDEYRIRLTAHIKTDDDIAYHKPGFDTTLLLATFKDYDKALNAFSSLKDVFNGSNSKVGDSYGQVKEITLNKNIRIDIGTYEKTCDVYTIAENTDTDEG